jgi:hypothetical protein
MVYGKELARARGLYDFDVEYVDYDECPVCAWDGELVKVRGWICCPRCGAKLSEPF